MPSTVALTTYPTSRADADETKSSQLFSTHLTDGVVWNVLNSAATTAGSGMAVNVATGRVAIGGFVGDISTITNLTIGAAHPSNPRIDRIIGRLDRTSPATISLFVLAGTAASSPTVPALSTGDIPLARVQVGAGVSSIVSANVTLDRQFTGDTGWLTYSPGVYPIDTGGTGTGWAAPSVVTNAGNIGRYRLFGMSCFVDVTQLVQFTTGAGFEYAFDLPKNAARRGTRGQATVQNVAGIAYTEPQSSAFGYSGTQISLASIRKYDSSALAIGGSATFDGFTFAYELATQ